jgi:hypothetical protein
LYWHDNTTHPSLRGFNFLDRSDFFTLVSLITLEGKIIIRHSQEMDHQTHVRAFQYNLKKKTKINKQDSDSKVKGQGGIQQQQDDDDDDGTKMNVR